jgi:lipoyl(octanoyl) transferase
VRELEVRHIGCVEYEEALALQRRLVEERKAGSIPDTLLLLEHPHVLTLGVRRGGRDNIVATAERLAELGVTTFETGRGGDVTYHGPGQVVGYPIIDLRPDRQDVHRYVRDLEEVMIRTCGDFGVRAERIKGLSGAWARPATNDPSAPPAELRKIAAIGVRIARWITSHGFAFNVTTDLEFFRLIVPCGIADRGVTSLAALAVHASTADVERRLVANFLAVFDRERAPSMAAETLL